MPPPMTLTISLLAALSGAPPRASVVARAVTARADSSGDDALVAVLIIGLAAVAAVALIGTGFLLAKRERVKDPPPSAMVQAAAALERRSVRRSKVRLSDDPIVAALGIHDVHRPRSRVRQVRDAEERNRSPLT